MVHDVNYAMGSQVSGITNCLASPSEPTDCGSLPAGFQPGTLPVEGEVFLHLMAIGEGLRQHIADVAARFDFTPQQALLVERLGSPRTMGQIAEALGCDKSNVTGLISRLEVRGLVTRTPDDHDRRIKWLTLTEDGLAVREMLREQILQGQTVINSFSEEERDTFLGYLRRASASLTTPMSDLNCGGAAPAGQSGPVERLEGLCRVAAPFDATHSTH